MNISKETISPTFSSILCIERNLNPKAACLKRREEEKVEEEAPEKRAVPGVDKPFDTAGGAVPGRGRGRRGRRSSRGGCIKLTR